MEEYQHIPLYYFTQDKVSSITTRTGTMEETKDQYKTTQTSIFLGSVLMQHNGWLIIGNEIEFY